jgi:hypothetical protein
VGLGAAAADEHEVGEGGALIHVEQQHVFRLGFPGCRDDQLDSFAILHACSVGSDLGRPAGPVAGKLQYA